MNGSRLDALYVRPGISTFPMKHQILTIRLSLQSVFRFCRQIYTQPMLEQLESGGIVSLPPKRPGSRTGTGGRRPRHTSRSDPGSAIECGLKDLIDATGTGDCGGRGGR